MVLATWLGSLFSAPLASSQVSLPGNTASIDNTRKVASPNKTSKLPHLFYFRHGPSHHYHHYHIQTSGNIEKQPLLVQRSGIAQTIVVDIIIICPRHHTMPGNGKIPQVAYLYEVDDDGNRVHGSKLSARKEKERPKISQQGTGKSRKSYRDSGMVAKYDEGISPGTKDVDVVTEKLERRKSTSSNKSPKKLSRPPSTHGNPAFPKLAISKKDDPSHFGIPPPTSHASPVVSQPQPIPFRPRAVTAHTAPARPMSYHSAFPSGGYATRPPLSSSAYFQSQYNMPPSYPPPSPSYLRYAATPQSQVDYFNTPGSTTPVNAPTLQERLGSFQQTTYADPLQRLRDPIQRTTSAFGVRDPIPQQIFDSAYDDGYISAGEGTVRRRVSIRAPPARSKQEVDYDTMPPPPRPSILRRPQTEYYADTSEPASRRDSRSVYRDDITPARRPSLRRNSVSYDLPDSDRVRVFEPANTGRRRRSYYGPSTESTGSSDYVSDKVRQAQTYQQDVGETIPLTADMLKRQQRRQAGSSRSTKSSGSRDESDYRKSATTRTTRSGSNDDDENVTIKVTGTARVMVGGAQIDCADGGEIEIKRQQKTIRNGSERGTNSEYGGTQRDRLEDRRSRVERPPGRSRMSSRGSYTRTPQWI